MNSTGLGFGVLGPLEMTIGGTPVPVGAAKQWAVLAMLVLNRNRAVSSDALIKAAWEESPPTEARATGCAHSRVDVVNSGKERQ